VGGIVVLRANSTINFLGGSVNVSQRGFRGETVMTVQTVVGETKERVILVWG
jgi:hypothetical protein